jgi:signal transduction histidine kinase
VKKVIVVITDVTARIERERAEQGQRELMGVFRRLLSDRAALDDFLEETSALIRGITAPSVANEQVLMRQIHTVKGNAALFGLESVASFCHELETDLAEGAPSPGASGATCLSPTQRDTLRALWTRALALRAELAGSRSDDVVELDSAEYDGLLRDLGARAPHDAMLRKAGTWRFELASKRFALIGEQIRALASRLGRGPVEVTFSPTDIRLAGTNWAPLWSAFAHLIRNAVDHGLESPEARASAGKPPGGRVELGIAREGDQVVVSIADDGPGIDWLKIEERARAAGLPHGSRADLEAAVFFDGLSSRAGATPTSGRGVGLGAVRALVERLGGRVEIESTGSGTTFRLVLPDSMLSAESPPCGGAERAAVPSGPGRDEEAARASLVL